MIYYSVSETNKLNTFCKENGYDKGKKAEWKWEDSYCQRLINDTKLERVYIAPCGNYNWCFLMDASQEVGK